MARRCAGCGEWMDNDEYDSNYPFCGWCKGQLEQYHDMRFTDEEKLKAIENAVRNRS